MMTTSAHFTWVPTTSRVVVVDGFGPFPRGAFQVLPAPLVWPAKDPADLLDFVVDYSEALAGDDGDAIATLDVGVAPSAVGDLAVTMSSADGKQAIIWLAGGQAGTTYSVTVVAGTNGGRSITRTISLPVALLSSPPPENVLTTELLKPITDQNSASLTTA